MATVEWTVLAMGDLVGIVDYISDDNPQAAQRLKDEVVRKVARLAEQPKLYRRGREVGTREMTVQPNYVIIYREQDAKVRILRVLHAARQWPE